MKTKIGTGVAHVTCDSDVTFKVKMSRVNLQGRGHIVAASFTARFIYLRAGLAQNAVRSSTARDARQREEDSPRSCQRSVKFCIL